MTLPNTYWLFNNTANDGANTGNASGGAGDASSNWVVIDLTNDTILFLDDQQTDGDSNSGTKYPIVIPDAGDLEAPKTFVDDDSANIFDQVPLAGTTNGEQSGGNTRYVFAICGLFIELACDGKVFFDTVAGRKDAQLDILQ